MGFGTRGSDGPDEPLLAPHASPRISWVYSPSGRKELVTGDVSNPPVGTRTPSGFNSEVTLVIKSSVWINFVLVIGKLYAFLISGSLALLASLVDSGIDLLGQGALMWTNKLASAGNHAEYPVGRGRLEPVGVMICAIVMGMASIEVISTSALKLIKYWDKGPNEVPVIVLTQGTELLLVGIIVLKAVLFVWCRSVAQRNPQNDSVKAIAQDNLNDIISNFAALVAPEVTSLGWRLWVVDPLAGIAISVYIIYTWVMTGLEQVEMIVGKKADAEFLEKVQNLAQNHHVLMQLDQLNAYHFGPKYLVEVEVVMPETTTLRESHDAGITLQHKIETLEEVERCFVHIDYQLRLHDDHDPDVPIEEKVHGGKSGRMPRAGDSPAAVVPV